MEPHVHPTAEVTGAVIGAGTKVWHYAQVGEGARVGEGCTVGKGVYIDRGVTVGRAVKIQNEACLYRGSVVEDGVFIGPHACLANDKRPRAVDPEGRPKRDGDWTPGRVLIREGASVGAGAVVLPGVTVGPWAMVGAGAVVAKDVPAHALAVGNPARVVGHVCRCGAKLGSRGGLYGFCPVCGEHVRSELEWE